MKEDKSRDSLAELGERLEKFAPRPDSLREKRLRDRTFASAVAVGFRLGVELLSGVLVGAGLGYFLDSVCGTKPWLMVVLLMAGSAAGFLNVYRFVKHEEKKD